MSVYFLKCKGTSRRKSEDIDNLYLEQSKLVASNSKMRYEIDQLNKIKFADENVFTLLKCINSPRQQVCNNGVCRSRFVDCTKFADLVLNDPVAKYRLTLAMNT